jgi:hypothetical protein
MMSVPAALTTVVVGVRGVVVDLVEVRARVSAEVTAEVSVEVSGGLRRGRRGARIAVPEAGRIGKASAGARC